MPNLISCILKEESYEVEVEMISMRKYLIIEFLIIEFLESSMCYRIDSIFHTDDIWNKINFKSWRKINLSITWNNNRMTSILNNDGLFND